VALRRFEPGQPLLAGPAVVGGDGRLAGVVRRVLAGLEGDGPWGAVVFDASGLEGSAGLRSLYEFFHPVVGRLVACGRVLVLCSDADPVLRRALEGFVRSVAKELRDGATAQLVCVAPDADFESTLRFFLSARSAYVSGQVVRIGVGMSSAPADWERPLVGKVAVVTGASGGIGAAVVEVLERDGAEVVAVDLPLDVTGEDAPGAIAELVRGGVDVVVHNAGVTRDRTLARMDGDEWDSVLEVNLIAVERLNSALVPLLRPGGRIVCVSSVSGIAGNRGQANYATSKAGLIGVVEALAPVLAERDCTINAVAPGFIETRMTAAMPLAVREAGRRMNSLGQAGLPIDVAETVAWLASPGSGGVHGNVVRVCGQSLIGA
jgi:3-oxoacyl-[acyl-carrier protein] reductase